MRIPFLVILSLAVVATSFGQTIGKRLPPPGIDVPEAVRESLQSKLRDLQKEIAAVEAAPKSDWDYAHLPDARVYEKAVRYALDHDEFFRTNEFTVAEKILAEGLKRIRAIAKMSAPWDGATGLVVRAYQSKIDRSIQPYGLVVPPTFKLGERKLYRLDVWLHGRDETLTELKFINERSNRPGEFTPPDTFVLHAYGRYCNAFKFAGEIDVMEAIEDAQEHYPIDASRVALRGFSMGGGGVWHLATHYADKWVVAAPGAGFAETARYMRLNVESIPAWERVLWQWYDATEYAANLFNCPTVAYSGELDKQKQAADVMAEALAREGLPLIHLIGPKAEHRYEPETKKLLANVVDTFALRGRTEFPREIRLTTRTLRYPKMHWLVLLGLEHHWERADARGILEGSRVRLWLTNVTSFALDFQRYPSRILSVEIDGKEVTLGGSNSTNLFIFSRDDRGWATGDFPAPMTKSPGLQGPIDDAFMDSFLFVTPTGTASHETTAAWIKKEMDRAVFEWRAQFRGEVRMVNDKDVTAEDLRQNNLILWGDPQSNEMIAKILPKLPLVWNSQTLKIGDRDFESNAAVPLLIYPNPLNPEKYVVLNSGFTFRGFGSNADQTPKLPDYAVLDIQEGNPFKTGIKAAGFFDERWRLSSERTYGR